jgi:acylphosphatase
MDRITVRVVIRGRVQGVGYRWWACEQARHLGVGGWVRNQRDGSVEVLASGEAEAVDELLEACRRGPASARVASVERFEAPDEDFAGFDERPTL